MSKPDAVEQRLQSLEGLVRHLTEEQARTQASLTSTHEILAATQRDLASCRSFNRELQHTISKCSSHIISQEAAIVKLRQENANIGHHLNAISHGITSFETRVAGAHHQLNERLTHSLAQQDGKIDNFQTNVLAPLFAALQPLISGNVAGLRDVQSTQGGSQDSGRQNAIASSSFSQPDVSQPDVSLTARGCAAVGRSRSMSTDSTDSNTPLAQSQFRKSTTPSSTSPARVASGGDALVSNSKVTTGTRLSTLSGPEETPLTAPQGHAQIPSPMLRTQVAVITDPPSLPSQPASATMTAQALLPSDQTSTSPQRPQPSANARGRASADVSNSTGSASPTLLKRKRTPSIEHIQTKFASFGRTERSERKPLLVNTALSNAPPSSALTSAAVHGPSASSKSGTRAEGAIVASASPPTRDALQAPIAVDSFQHGSQARIAAPSVAKVAASKQADLPSNKSIPSTRPRSPRTPPRSTSAEEALDSVDQAASEKDTAQLALSRRSESSSHTQSDTTQVTRSVTAVQRPQMALVRVEPQSAEIISADQLSAQAPLPSTRSTRISASSPSLLRAPALQHAKDNAAETGPSATKEVTDRKSSNGQQTTPATSIKETPHQPSFPQSEGCARQPSPLPSSSSMQRIPDGWDSDPKRSESSTRADKTATDLAGSNEAETRLASRNADSSRPLRDRLMTGDYAQSRYEPESASLPAKHTREGRSSRVGWLAGLKGSIDPSQEDGPFWAWAWLGESITATPLVISTDSLIADSLVSEPLADRLVRDGNARKVDSRNISQWIEIDLRFLHTTSKPTERTDDMFFQAARCLFLVVPRVHMKDGIYLGRKELDLLNLALIPRRLTSPPCLAVDGEPGVKIDVTEFPSFMLEWNLTKPLKRLCVLAWQVQKRKPPREVGSAQITLEAQANRAALENWRKKNETANESQRTASARSSDSRLLTRLSETPTMAVKSATSNTPVSANIASAEATKGASVTQTSDPKEKQATALNLNDESSHQPRSKDMRLSSTGRFEEDRLGGFSASFDTGSPLSELSMESEDEQRVAPQTYEDLTPTEREECMRRTQRLLEEQKAALSREGNAASKPSGLSVLGSSIRAANSAETDE